MYDMQKIMKTIEEIKTILAKEKGTLRQKYCVKGIGLFGSYLRGQAKENSDLDILVEFDKTIGLLKFVSLENYLSEMLGIKADLVMKDVLKPRIGKHILKEVIYI